MTIIKKRLPHAFIDTHWLKSKLPYLILFGAVSLVCIVVLGRFLFGGKLLLFADIGSDTFYSYYAIYFFFTNYITNWQLPLWSFNIGIGACVLAFFPFLYDPFSIIYYLGGVDNLSRLLVWVFVLKIFLSATFTFIYLRYIKIDNYASLITSLLFAFNGFLMCWGQHYHFASSVVFLPLILLTIEIWFKTNKWLPMLLAVSFLALKIVLLFQISIFCFLYIAVRIALEKEKFTKYEIGIRIIKLFGIYALGLGVSAFLWLPEYYLLTNSPRISSGLSQPLLNSFKNFFTLNTQEYYISLLSRVFSNNLQGIGSYYSGFRNYYESIQLYVGILPLLLIPQLYIVFPKKEKWVSSIVLVGAAVFLLTPGFSQIMNGFQYPAYRWGYNIVIFELLLAALVLNSMLKHNKINVYLLAATGIVLFLCLTGQSLLNYHEDINLNKANLIITYKNIALIILYSILIYTLIIGKIKIFAFSFIMLLACFEMAGEHYDTFNKRSLFSKGIEFNRSINFFDYGNEASKKIKKVDSSIYRIEKNHWILSLNDSLIQDYYGLDSYWSLNNPSYLSFLKSFDYKSRHLNVVKWNSLDYPYLADILSVKYHLTKNDDILPPNVKYMDKFGDVSVYSRSNSLPFGFTYDSYIPISVFTELSKLDKERALLQGVVIEEDLPSNKLKEISNISPFQEEVFFRKKLIEDILIVSKMSEDRIQGNIYLNSSKLLFLSIPFDDGWSAYINDKKVDIHKVNLGFSGIYLEQGNSRVELKYVPPYMKIGMYISILSILIIVATKILFSSKVNGIAIKS